MNHQFRDAITSSEMPWYKNNKSHCQLLFFERRRRSIPIQNLETQLCWLGWVEKKKVTSPPKLMFFHNFKVHQRMRDLFFFLILTTRGSKYPPRSKICLPKNARLIRQFDSWIFFRAWKFEGDSYSGFLRIGPFPKEVGPCPGSFFFSWTNYSHQFTQSRVTWKFVI